MSGYLWTFDLHLLEKCGGLPEELLLPVHACHVVPQDVIGRDVWLVAASGQSRYLFGRAHVDAMAEADDPPDTFILITNQLRSCRFLPSLSQERSVWKLTIDILGEGGLRGCSQVISTECEKLIRTNKISRVHPQSIRDASLPVGSSSAALRRRYAWILRRYPFGDLQGNDRFRELSPFGAALQASGDHADESLEALRKFDLRLLSQGDDHSDASFTEAHTAPAPAVDLLLTRFDPGKAPVRRFLAHPQRCNGLEALAKTQRAESVHQAIIADLVKFLESENVTPLQSRSVDLAFGTDLSYTFVEVKSADEQNVTTQAEEGLIQILRYRAAARMDDLQIVNSLVIVGRLPSADICDYLSLLGREADVTFLFYDLSVPWPDRVPGLVPILRGRPPF